MLKPSLRNVSYTLMFTDSASSSVIIRFSAQIQLFLAGQCIFFTSLISWAFFHLLSWNAVASRSLIGLPISTISTLISRCIILSDSTSSISDAYTWDIVILLIFLMSPTASGVGFDVDHFYNPCPCIHLPWFHHHILVKVSQKLTYLPCRYLREHGGS